MVLPLLFTFGSLRLFGYHTTYPLRLTTTHTHVGYVGLVTLVRLRLLRYVCVVGRFTVGCTVQVTFTTHFPYVTGWFTVGWLILLRLRLHTTHTVYCGLRLHCTRFTVGYGYFAGSTYTRLVGLRFTHAFCAFAVRTVHVGLPRLFCGSGWVLTLVHLRLHLLVYVTRYTRFTFVRSRSGCIYVVVLVHLPHRTGCRRRFLRLLVTLRCCITVYAFWFALRLVLVALGFVIPFTVTHLRVWLRFCGLVPRSRTPFGWLFTFTFDLFCLPFHGCTVGSFCVVGLHLLRLVAFLLRRYLSRSGCVVTTGWFGSPQLHILHDCPHDAHLLRATLVYGTFGYLRFVLHVPFCLCRLNKTPHTVGLRTLFTTPVWLYYIAAFYAVYLWVTRFLYFTFTVRRTRSVRWFHGWLRLPFAVCLRPTLVHVCVVLFAVAVVALVVRLIGLRSHVLVVTFAVGYFWLFRAVRLHTLHVLVLVLTLRFTLRSGLHTPR